MNIGWFNEWQARRLFGGPYWWGERPREPLINPIIRFAASNKP
jgi:hypothetical protein